MINRWHVLAFVVVLASAALAQAQTFTTVYNFTGGSDGGNPYAGVIQDKAGNLYGVTSGCGANNWGALYELRASGTLTLLHSFSGTDGESPYGEVLLTANGELFGTATSGGAYGYGTVWSYVP